MLLYPSITLLILYLIGILALGVAAHRKSRKSIEDYFLANRGIGLWLLVGTIVATVVNSLAVTGTPALLYEGGVLFGQMFIVVLVPMGLMWVFGPRIGRLGREKGLLTLGDLFADHYQSRVVLALTAGFGMLSIFPFLAIQLVGIGKILAATTGGAIPQEMAVVLCAVSIGIYLFLGGARASVWTDSLQGLIALVVFAGSAVLFASWSGGLAESVEKMHQLMPEKMVFNSVNTPLFIDNVLSWSFAFFLWPHIFQRMFMARTPQSVRQTAAISLAVIYFLLFCVLIMAIAATAELYGTLADPDQLIATMFRNHLPVGGAFLAILIFALAMSTIDSMLLALGSSATRDVWKGLMRKEGASRSGFNRGRWITSVFLIIATLFAITAVGRGAIVPWVTLGASIATLFLWPFLGVFVWKRASTQSVVSAMVLGFFAIGVTRFTSVGDVLPFGFATAGFLVGALSFLVVGFLAPSVRPASWRPVNTSESKANRK